MTFFICQSCGTEYEAETPKCPACGRTETIRLNRSDRLVDKVIAGRFKIVRKLGQGGMGAVYLAEQIGIGHRLALKFLKSEFSTDAEIARRFLNEAKTYARVTHPNAVTFHEFGQDDEGNLFIAMEYCEGVDLKRTIAERGRLTLVEAVEVVTQVADVLADAHEKQIVHRDLKPENIMIRKGLRGMHAKVLDFGIARILDATTKLTVAGAIAGTPRYMSPEQVEGREADQRADIYSLGIICFESLTGRQPFDGNTISEIMRKQVIEPLPRLAQDVPELDLPALQEVLDRACAKRSSDRFPDMVSFATALSQAIPTQLHLSLPPLQRVASESRRQATGSGSNPPDVVTGIATGTVVDTADATGATMMRTQPPAPAGPTPVVPTPMLVTPRVGSPSLAAASQASVTQSGTLGAIDPSRDLGREAEAPLTVSRSKGPLVAVGALVVVAVAIGIGVAVSGGGASAGTTTAPPPVPDVAPPLVPVAAEPPKPTPNPSQDVATEAIRLLRNQAGQALLTSGRASWDKGELEAARLDLEKVEAGTDAFDTAQQLLGDIKTVTEALAAGNAAFKRGDCQAALKAFSKGQRLNTRVAAVNDGIRSCQAATVPENIE
ncbi:MAG: protein kinase [Myxococcaceae bacterium]|nr:protein kinase [Myxococcaceae bacterium]MCA3013815.1 protein kinase [Myxococcaceae bacterium]